MSNGKYKKEIGDLDDYDKYYGSKTWCWNCNNTIYLYIVKGVPKETVTTACETCGCMNKMSGGKT